MDWNTGVDYWTGSWTALRGTCTLPAKVLGHGLSYGVQPRAERSFPIMAEGSLMDPIVIEDCAVSSPVKILEGSKYR